MEMDYGNMLNLLSIHLTRCIYRQFTDNLQMCFLSQLVVLGETCWSLTLARAVPSGMAPPAGSCDDSAKAYCKWFFGRKKHGKNRFGAGGMM